MEEKKVTFEEKLTQLLELAKTKKNVLDNKEILNYFHGEILSPEQLDQIYDFLENHHVDVLRMDDDEDMEPELFEDGEQAKVRLCKLINRETNLLLLDEPTNHLDVEAKEELKRALAAYKGNILLICHEPDFYEGFATKVWDCSEWSLKI